MRLHYDISAGAFVSAWASNTLLRSDELSIKRSDALAIEFVPFTSTGLGIAEKATATGLQCGFFVPDEHGSNALFGTSTFVASLEDVDGVTDARRVYTGRPTSSTLEVATRFVGLTTHKTNSGAAYTLIASDADKLLALTHSSAIVLTLANAVAIGDSLVVLNNSTGQELTLVAGTGISTITYDGVDDTIVAGVVRMLTRTSSTEWTVSAVNEESSIEVDLEFQWEQDAERLSSSTLTITLYNDYLRDTEATPEALGLTSNYVTLAAFEVLETQVADLEADYTGHTHVIADTTGLQAAIDAKQATLTDVITAGTSAFPASVTVTAKGITTEIIEAERAVILTAIQTIAGTPLTVSASGEFLSIPNPSIEAGSISVGDVFEVVYFGRTKNGTTASTVGFNISVGGTFMAGPSFAMGTTPATDVPFHFRAVILVTAISGANVTVTSSMFASWKTSAEPANATGTLTSTIVFAPRVDVTVTTGTQLNIDGGYSRQF